MIIFKNVLFTAVPPTQTYSQQMMTQLCNDWQASMYNVSTNGHMPFMSGLTYHHPGYNLGVEIQDVNYGRENGRRNNRGRGMRRDNYNRAINSTNNEVQSGYMGDQAQFHPQIHPIMYIYPDHHSVSTQQHQVAVGQIYYPPPMYSSILHPHPNAQPISPSSHTQATYPPNPPQMDRCVRQSQPVPLEQSNQEIIKQPIVKVQNEHVQSTNKTVNHQINEDNHDSLQSNVVNNVIATNVNNSTSESVKNMNENTANTKTMASSEKDVKIVHNTVWTENCNGTQIDVPCISTNNLVEMNKNGEVDKTFKNEATSNITTIVTQTLPKSVSTKTDKSEMNIEENVVVKDAQDNTVEHKIPNGSSVTSNDSSVMPKIPSSEPISTNITPSATTIPRSYASLLKKDSIETQTLTSYKPTIHMIEQNNSNMPTEKESTGLNSAPKNQNDSSSMPNIVNDYKTLQNGMLQNCYDDPNSYRIGGKYKSQSNVLE